MFNITQSENNILAPALTDILRQCVIEASSQGIDLLECISSGVGSTAGIDSDPSWCTQPKPICILVSLGSSSFVFFFLFWRPPTWRGDQVPVKINHTCARIPHLIESFSVGSSWNLSASGQAPQIIWIYSCTFLVAICQIKLGLVWVNLNISMNFPLSAIFMIHWNIMNCSLITKNLHWLYQWSSIYRA